VYVLFPSEDSACVQDTVPKDLDNLYQSLQPNDVKPMDFHFHVFVIDGTWNEARMLNRRESFEKVKRLKIDVPSDYNYVFKLVRTGKVEGRISTIEAVTLLLQDFNKLGTSEVTLPNSGITFKESEVSKDFNDSITAIYDNLNEMIEISGVKYRRHHTK